MVLSHLVYWSFSSIVWDIEAITENLFHEKIMPIKRKILILKLFSSNLSRSDKILNQTNNLVLIIKRKK